MFTQLHLIRPDIFDFHIVDYDTHSGYDAIVKEKDNVPIKTSRLYYVEFKHLFMKKFNHSFENLYSIICWRLYSQNAAHGDEFEDIAGEIRTLEIIPPASENDYTRYFLNDPRKGKKIEIYVLEQYLKEKYGVTFKPRTEKDIY